MLRGEPSGLPETRRHRRERRESLLERPRRDRSWTRAPTVQTGPGRAAAVETGTGGPARAIVRGAYSAARRSGPSRLRPASQARAGSCIERVGHQLRPPWSGSPHEDARECTPRASASPVRVDAVSRGSSRPASRAARCRSCARGPRWEKSMRPMDRRSRATTSCIGRQAGHATPEDEQDLPWEDVRAGHAASTSRTRRPPARSVTPAEHTAARLARVRLRERGFRATARLRVGCSRGRRRLGGTMETRMGNRAPAQRAHEEVSPRPTTNAVGDTCVDQAARARGTTCAGRGALRGRKRA